MDSLSDLYAALLNLPKLKVERVEMSKKQLSIYCHVVSSAGQVCPKCLSKVWQKTPKYRREVRDLDISGRKVILHLLVHQYLCDCGRTFSETFEFVAAGKSYTKRQAKWIFEMSAKQNHLQVGALVDMNHKTVERICYEQVELRQIDWDRIKRIGIDEFAFKKGHKDFIVVLIDLDTHELIDLLEHRNKAFLRTYFQGLGKKVCAKVKDFCSDMWGPFQDLAKELFPHARIHVDRFHWTIHLNKVLDNFRKALRRKHTEESAFKNLKWKLIKRPEQLKEQDRKELQQAFEIAPELEKLYQMRNEFQAIFDAESSYEEAAEQVQRWIEQANRLKNKYLDMFLKLFHRHRNNIMNYFKCKISSGAVEGTNNLLRTSRVHSICVNYRIDIKISCSSYAKANNH